MINKEVKQAVEDLCDLCAKHDVRFDMTFTYDPYWTTKDYCYKDLSEDSFRHRS